MLRFFFWKGRNTLSAKIPIKGENLAFKVQNLPSSKPVDKTGCRAVGDFKTRCSTCSLTGRATKKCI